MRRGGSGGLRSGPVRSRFLHRLSGIVGRIGWKERGEERDQRLRLGVAQRRAPLLHLRDRLLPLRRRQALLLHVLHSVAHHAARQEHHLGRLLRQIGNRRFGGSAEREQQRKGDRVHRRTSTRIGSIALYRYPLGFHTATFGCAAPLASVARDAIECTPGEAFQRWRNSEKPYVEVDGSSDAFVHRLPPSKVSSTFAIFASPENATPTISCSPGAIT